MTTSKVPLFGMSQDLDGARYGTRRRGSPGDELLFRRPEEFCDGVDLAQETVGDVDVVGLLRVAGALGRHPEEVVKVRELLQVFELEVVGPQHPEVMLHEVGAFLLDEGRAD